MTRLLSSVRLFGPYLLTALIVPGGLILAPLLWLLRHGNNRNIS